MSAEPTPVAVGAPAGPVFRGPLKVEYCSACSMPPEYCEFGPCWDKCKVLLEKKHPDILAAALAKMSVSSATPTASSTTATAPAPAGDDAKESESASSTTATPAKKKARFEDDDEEDDDDSDEDGESEKKKKPVAADEDDFLAAAAPIKPKKVAASAGPGIYLSMANRSKKKFITTIRGFDSFGIVLKDVAKLLAKKFACAASVVKASDSTGGSEIDIQGDLIQDLPHWIIEAFPQVDKKLIWTVDKAGKKCKAF